MFEKLRVVFSIPELRWKILLTLGFLLIYRIGWQIPLPIVNPSELDGWMRRGPGQTAQDQVLSQVWSQVAMFSASGLSQATIFGLGIMPYISASIIFQLLSSAWKPLEDLKKEGESGQRKINEYTRYFTVLLCLVQSGGYLYYLSRQSTILRSDLLLEGNVLPLSWFVGSVLIMTAGTVFLMWIGEQIDEHGIGNGISLLIMAGILAEMPGAMVQMYQSSRWSIGEENGPDTLMVLAALFIAVVAGVVFITQAQRRIPTHSQRHTRGRKVFGGGRSYIPLRINQAGVMPIIFASSLLMLPAIAIYGMTAMVGEGNAEWLQRLQTAVSDRAGVLHNVLYVGGIYFFCYFWTAITFNPKEMSEELKKHGAFIPGHRPGNPTAQYLEKVAYRITYVGAAFLALVAIIPTMIGGVVQLPSTVAQFFGGTGLLIAVSVAFDLVQKIDSHLVMRNYRGLLER